MSGTSEVPLAGEPPAPEAAPRCYKCEAELSVAGAEVCTQCGRRQLRTCFCGASISRGAASCPHCGADWTRVRRARRRRTSRWTTWRTLASYALIGGAAAILAALLIRWAWGELEHLSAPDAGDVWGALGQAAGVAARPLLVFLLGAAIGAVAYALRQRRKRHRRLAKRLPAKAS